MLYILVFGFIFHKKVNKFYLVVAYENESLIDIFELTTGNVKYSLDFDKNVKNIACNTLKTGLNDFQNQLAQPPLSVGRW